MKQTGLADSIDVSGDRARLDAVAKKLIRHKVILAWILKESVAELSGYDIRYIEKNCIVGEVRIGEVAVDQDVSGVGIPDAYTADAEKPDVNMADAKMPDAEISDAYTADADIPDADATITGSNTEDVSDHEGRILFDLVFDARIPNQDDLVIMIVHIEVQGKLDSRYPLITRIIYYLARLISRQKGTVFTNSDYGKIRKVCSIWICLDPKKADRNSVVEYGLKQKKVFGDVDEPAENYDKMKAVIISLNEEGAESDSKIIRLLSTLLSGRKPVEERKRILEEEYGIPMTKEMQEEVDEMYSLSMAYEEIGFEKGIKQGIEQGIEQGIKQGIEQAVDIYRTEMGLDDESIIRKICDKFSLTNDRAQAYVRGKSQSVSSAI